MPIPRDSRNVIDQSISAAGNAVKQRGFSNIGATDNGYNGFHKRLQFPALAFAVDVSQYSLNGYLSIYCKLI
jgi:hypothetical protein